MATQTTAGCQVVTQKRPVVCQLTTVIVLLLVVQATAGTARLLVWPPTAPLRHADAIVVLAGQGDRVPKAIALARMGYAPFILLSLGGRPEEPCNISHSPVPYACFRAQQFNTRGEARSVAAIAKIKGWHGLIVVSSVTQATRAELRFQRCFPGRVIMAPVRFTALRLWAYNIAYEWAAGAKAVFLQRGC